MRQLKDLLVWLAMIGVLSGVVYYTPKFAEYMSGDNQPTPLVVPDHSIALRLPHAHHRSE
jgi:hypothetical protein